MPILLKPGQSALCSSALMEALAQQFACLKCPSLSSSSLSKPTSRHPSKPQRARVSSTIVATSVAISSIQNKERQKLKELFEDAYERCNTAPMEVVSFTVEDFQASLEKYDFNLEIGTKVKGSIFRKDLNGALVDITAKSSAYLPIQEACIYKIKHVEEARIFPGLQEEFVIIGESDNDDSLVSLRSI